jgi:PIN domain nuclease of toxin-antitoxin system
VTAFLIDTHVFAWLKSARRRIREEALKALSDPAAGAFFSAASAAELFDKYSKGGETSVNNILAGGVASLREALDESGIAPLDVTLPHAAAIGRLPPHHADPVDRLLIAQAVVEGMTLVSADAAFRLYSDLRLLKA